MESLSQCIKGAETNSLYITDLSPTPQRQPAFAFAWTHSWSSSTKADLLRTLLHLNFARVCHALYVFLHEYWLKWIIRDQRCCTQTQSWKAAVNCSKGLKFAWKNEYCSATISSESHVTLEVLWWQDSHPIYIASHKSLSAWTRTSGTALTASPGAEEEKLRLLRVSRGKSAWPAESSNAEHSLSKGWVDSKVCPSFIKGKLPLNCKECCSVLSCVGKHSL